MTWSWPKFSIIILKCMWHEKYFLLIWKAFQNTEEWHFSFWNIFFRFRDIDVFLLCKLDQWWRQYTDTYKYRKNFFDSDFPSPCFDVPKASNFTSGGVQNRETKNRRPGTIVTSFQDFKLRKKQISPTFSYFLINNALLYHFLANWLTHNEKMSEK